MSQRPPHDSEIDQTVHDPSSPDVERPRPAVEPSAEAPGGESEAPSRVPERIVDARVRPEAVPEPLLADFQVHRLLRRTRAPAVPHSRQVFVNRNLRLDRIEAVGFDMDYTLAVYHLTRIETLSYQMTLDVLVEQMGYPRWLRRLEYNPEFVIRGLVVDKHLGNILKMDRHAHVGRVFHGLRRLSKEERIRHYRTQKIRLGSDRYAWIDTLFALPEAVLYAQVIQGCEDAGEAMDPHRLYGDIREAIDQVHRDGSLKAVLQKDLAYYIRRDPELAPTLHKLRSSGKRLFLLTNSFWTYTSAVMSFLLDGVLPEYPSWRGYFDLVVVGAHKPAFFSEGRPFLRVDPETAAVGESAAESLDRGAVYEGGNLKDLERMTGWGGDGVLYVGDHIYGDILRTKRSGLWRTAMVIQELEDEIEYGEGRRGELDRLDRLDALRFRLDDELNLQKNVVSGLERRLERRNGGLEPEERGRLEREWMREKADLDQLRAALRAVIRRVEDLAAELEQGRNRYWGFLFKEDNENSRFGDQVTDYACLYTSRVSNLLAYSPTQYFRARRDRMPHDLPHL